MSAILRRIAPTISDQQRAAAREFVRAFQASSYCIQTVKRTNATRTRNNPSASPDELVKLVDTGSLVHVNPSGSCIFARPNRRDLILVDDLPPHPAAALASHGFEPAAIIQSLPATTNVIIRFPTISNDNAPLYRLVHGTAVDPDYQQRIGL